MPHPEPIDERLGLICRDKGASYSDTLRKLGDILEGETRYLVYSTPFKMDSQIGKIVSTRETIADVIVVTKSLLFDFEIGEDYIDYGIYPLESITALEMTYEDTGVIASIDIVAGLSGLEIADDRDNADALSSFVKKLRRKLWG